MIGPITDRATFRALSHRSRRARVPGLGVRARLCDAPGDISDNNVTDVRVSYAIGRRVGSAVVRNRLRRRLRAVVDELHEGPDGPLPPGDFLLVAEPELVDTSPDELRTRVGDVIAAVTAEGGRS